jgi:hypothetical protein
MRARALRTLVVLGSLTRKTGCCAPPAPPIAASLDNNDVKKKLRENSQLGKKSTKEYHNLFDMTSLITRLMSFLAIIYLDVGISAIGNTTYLASWC